MTQESKAEQRLKVYQQWEGAEVFFCDGYLVAGPNWKASAGTALLIICPTAIFIAFPAVYLTLHVHAIIMVFSCVLPVCSLLFLFMTACTDPGIIPRQEPDEEFLGGRKPRTKEVFINSQRVVIRYNDTCHFYQPPRAHHCSVNDNCIERFDHHCPWVGTTIGKRNYRTFLLFVYTTTVFCLYVIGCCLAQLFVRHNELDNSGTQDAWLETVKDVAPALALLGFTFLLSWFVGGLSFFHCYLVGTNQTTYENFRYNNDSRPNPYDLGLLANCCEVWCEPLPASKVRFRDPIPARHNTMPTAGEVQLQQGRPDQQQQQAAAYGTGRAEGAVVGFQEQSDQLRQQQMELQQEFPRLTYQGSTPPVSGLAQNSALGGQQSTFMSVSGSMAAVPPVFGDRSRQGFSTLPSAAASNPMFGQGDQVLGAAELGQQQLHGGKERSDSTASIGGIAVSVSPRQQQQQQQQGAGVEHVQGSPEGVATSGYWMDAPAALRPPHPGPR